MTNARKILDPSSFYDIHYNDLLKDPFGKVHDIYKYFGYNHNESLNKRMRNWLTKNSQHKKGVHRHSLEQFGLNEDKINNLFSQYISDYNIPN